MKPIIYNMLTVKSSKNFENKVQKLLPDGVYEIYLQSCGMKRASGYGSYYFVLNACINNENHELKIHTNSAPGWDDWQDLENGTTKHDNWNKNTALYILEDQKEWVNELVNP